jgi:hypothetical protein
MILPSFRSHFHVYISFGRCCYRDVLPSTLIWLDLIEVTNPAHERTDWKVPNCCAGVAHCRDGSRMLTGWP